jgi:hypothetical protein
VGLVVHSEAEAMAAVRAISKVQYAEGVVIFNPHRERQVRKEKGKRLSYQTWPASLADRAINAITHLKKKFGGEIGLEVACKRLETPNPEEEEIL